MALISVDEPPAPGVNGSVASDISLVIPALDDLMGEALFPVFQGDGITDPNIVALDSSGAAVAVDLVDELDRRALLRGLNHAGAVGRMSRGELAARYPSGLEGFQHELAGYLSAMPYRRPRPSGDGGRLVIICSGANPEVWNAIAFLNRPDGPVKVLRANSLQAIDGQTFVDVSPFVIPKDAGSAKAAVYGQMITRTAESVTAVAPVMSRAERRRRQQGQPASAPTSIVDYGKSQPSSVPSRPIASQPVVQQAVLPQGAAATVNRPSRKALRAMGELGHHSVPVRSSVAERQIVPQPSQSPRGAHSAGRLANGESPSAAKEKVEFTGVFARGTDATDHLSWDTTSLPVIARPRRNPLER